MTQIELQKLACALSSLSVFRGILRHPAMTALLDYLRCTGTSCARMSHFGDFVYALADDGYSFSALLRRLVFADENRYITDTARRRPVSAVTAANAAAELALFSRLSRLDADALCASVEDAAYVPQFANEEIDFARAYAERLAEIDRWGYGIFAEHVMFRVEDGELLPVESADPISLEQFVGYEAERARVLENTRALAEGRPAANVLLFGDAGTGKSSTVKACANFFADRGVRLIELRKDQLLSLSAVMGRIADNPLRFILFIDDLSFNKNDDTFSMLKAALEGSASARATNAVIYATSNRRHIVKENFSDRAGEDDIHHSDTVQELTSLSDRFGLTVYFERPNRALYLDIVHQLADRAGLTLPRETLELRAEAFALAKGSRSPRAAEQFVCSLLQALPDEA